MKNKYNIIGLMSGTSLDGVDIAYCEFVIDRSWSFHIHHAETVEYNNEWLSILEKIHLGSAEEISAVDCSYGNYLGTLVKIFCSKNNISPDFISSHGHTIFHQPKKGFTKQIGSGANISAQTGLPVVCDFRSLDVALGGQGAPLVPIGDKLLFIDADYCLNLGGIANISFDQNNELTAFDICACNLILNYYARQKGIAYDENGQLASMGKVSSELLNKLNSLNYFSIKPPKSLGREDIERDMLPLINSFKLSIEDILHTCCDHIAQQISNVVSVKHSKKRMLVTGGGAFNNFLIERIIEKCNVEVIVPERKIVEFKEALIFAFLGVLRMRNEINCIKSVTGASENCSGGAVYKPF